MISYEAPPRLSAESILTAKTLKALYELSEPPPVIDLLCASPGDEVPADQALDELLPKNIRVDRTDPIPKGRTSLLRRIIGGKGGWQDETVARAAALFPAEHKKPALIYSRSHPPASHLAALELVEGHLKGVPWVAHFSDPWSQHAYYKSPVTRAALARYEARVFAAATYLVFVSETLRDTMLHKAAPEIKAKAHVFPHQFDPALYGKAPLPHIFEAARTDSSERVIAHVGDLYGLRTPESLFLAYAQLQNGKPQLKLPALWLIGRLDPEFAGIEVRENIAQHVKHFTPIPYLESLNVMAAADVLLTVEAPLKKSIFFPSKLVDYLGARKPMLAITPKGSLTSRLMETWNQPWCDVGDPCAIAAALERVAAGDLWAPPDAEVLSRYTSARVAGDLAALFRQAVGNSIVADDGGANQ